MVLLYFVFIKSQQRFLREITQRVFLASPYGWYGLGTILLACLCSLPSSPQQKARRGTSLNQVGILPQIGQAPTDSWPAVVIVQPFLWVIKNSQQKRRPFGRHDCFQEVENTPSFGQSFTRLFFPCFSMCFWHITATDAVFRQAVDATHDLLNKFFCWMQELPTSQHTTLIKQHILARHAALPSHKWVELSRFQSCGTQAFAFYMLIIYWYS
jgi:hypothetical protein